VKIRAVDGADQKIASALTWLQLEILPNDVPADPSAGHWWIAYDGDSPVAFAAVMQSVRWSDAGYLNRAGVLTSHRGKGLQKRLIRVREAKARALGWNWLITDTRHNPASANSLISCGYRIFLPSQPWGHADAVYWRKALK
jgi:GNAT superfamily N-acetyltransferase